MANYPSFNPNSIQKSDIPFMKLPSLAIPLNLDQFSKPLQSLQH